MAVILARFAEFKLVVDTNVLVRGLANRSSSSGRLLRLCENRDVALLLSRPVMVVYREVLLRDELTDRHPSITAEVVGLVIERLRYFAEVIDPVRAHFAYDRDPDDACFVELAIAGGATHIVTHDDDLLSLPKGRADSAKRFRQRLPRTKVIGPGEVLREFEVSRA